MNADTEHLIPAPAPAPEACSPLARLLAEHQGSRPGEAGLTAASGAGWQSLVEHVWNTFKRLSVFFYVQW